MENNGTWRPTVVVIGAGNVASHLVNAFGERALATAVNPHTLDGMPEHPDFTIISVKDRAVAEVAEKIGSVSGIVAHTSGSVPMEALGRAESDRGVFYPLQTFTKGTPLNYAEIPFFIEGSSPRVEKNLARLARLISDSVFFADSEKRKQLHLASVFACNFTNCLMGISREILSEGGIDFRVMLPLLRQTIAKLSVLSPSEAQTGPAVREDFPVMESHLRMLAGDPRICDVYRLLSEIIIKNKQDELHKL